MLENQQNQHANTSIQKPHTLHSNNKQLQFK